jgi:hypothetical protein
MKIEGGCHCGNIGYEAEIDPDAVGICHCTDCQALTGTAYRLAIAAPAATFVLRRGEPKIYIKTAESGRKRAQAFCPECGTPIYAAAVENTPTYNLRVGTIKHRTQLGKPKWQIWCRSALPWVMNLEGVLKFDRELRQP